MALTLQQVLLSNGFVQVPNTGKPSLPLLGLTENRHVLTLINNMAHYGYVPSIEVIRALLSLDEKELAVFWREVDAALADITAANRKMDDFVVYKNFPKEVLDLSQAEYWCKQILMYWGFDKEHFVQPEAERPVIKGLQNRKVLHLAAEDTVSNIWNSLLSNRSRWSTPQQENAKFMLDALKINHLDVDTVAFKENAIQLASLLLDSNPAATAVVNNATDVLRLAALRSGQDVSLRKPIKFKSFSRKERRFLCLLLNNSKHLESDMAERQALFKLLLRRLHPGDFKRYTRLDAAYSNLYKGQLASYASQVEKGIIAKDKAVLKLVASRPGDFARRLHKLYEVFGSEAITAFSAVMPKLTNHQLVKMVKYVETIGNRSNLTFPPKGNWTKLQVVANTKVAFAPADVQSLRESATAVIRDRISKLIPDGVDLDLNTDLVKLQTNDQELASYGRGTVFPIPQEATFLRTASYWENKGGVSWFDNGWNFFDAAWTYKGACCWNSTAFGRGYHDGYYRRGEKFTSQAAVFSGDPVNSKEMRGRAAQMIDLYIDRLLEEGVRYAVWNILCFSRIPFDKATGEVVASLQWGEQPETGKLYEPSRAQMVFPLKGSSFTKYVAYIDLEKRQLVYMDANLKANTNSAASNGPVLSQQMPAFVEYLNSLPSVADLLLHANQGKTPVVYSDKDKSITENAPAYVFKPENSDNQFKQLDLSKLLG